MPIECSTCRTLGSRSRLRRHGLSEKESARTSTTHGNGWRVGVRDKFRYLAHIGWSHKSRNDQTMTYAENTWKSFGGYLLRRGDFRKKNYHLLSVTSPLPDSESFPRWPSFLSLIPPPPFTFLLRQKKWSSWSFRVLKTSRHFHSFRPVAFAPFTKVCRILFDVPCKPFYLFQPVSDR